MNIIDKIEEMMGDLSPASLIDAGYIRVNGPDIGLHIRAGTVFLDLENKAIIALGDTQRLEYYGHFSFIEECNTMKVQMGNQKISVYLDEDDIVKQALNYYHTVYLTEVKKNEEEFIH